MSVTRRRSEPQSLAALLSTREVVVFCGSGGVGKTSTAAAAALTAAARLGGKVLVLTIDPAKRLADALGLEAFGNVGAPGAARRLRRARRGAARRAVGGDARHQALVGRAGAAPRARRGDRVPHPRQPDVPQRHQPLRAEPRLHRDGAAVRGARERRVRPHRHRHAADPERDRLPRGARAHGRLLRRSAAALAHHAVPHRRAGAAAACSTPRASPSTRWPIACSAVSSSRTSPSSSSTSSRCTRGSSSAPTPSSSCCTTGARRSRSSPRSRARRCARPRRSAASSPPATSTSAHSCSTRSLPEYLLSPDGEHAADVFSRESDAIAGELAATGVAGLDDADVDRTGAAHGRRLVPQLRGRRPARGRAAHRADAARHLPVPR